MPVHKYGIQSRHDREDLVSLIADELLIDSEGKTPMTYEPPDMAPQIYIDENRGPDRLHITVIGSFWEGVAEVQRPAIILDAFCKAGRREAADHASIAMGLTPHEASALGYNMETN